MARRSRFIPESSCCFEHLDVLNQEPLKRGAFSCPRPCVRSARKGIGVCCGACLRACVRHEKRYQRDLVRGCRAAECHAGAGFPGQQVTRVRACLDAESPRMNGGEDIVSIVCSSGCLH